MTRDLCPLATESFEVVCGFYFWRLIDTVDGWNPAPVEFGSFSHYLGRVSAPSKRWLGMGFQNHQPDILYLATDETDPPKWTILYDFPWPSFRSLISLFCRRSSEKFRVGRKVGKSEMNFDPAFGTDGDILDPLSKGAWNERSIHFCFTKGTTNAVRRWSWMRRWISRRQNAWSGEAWVTWKMNIYIAFTEDGSFCVAICERMVRLGCL